MPWKVYKDGAQYCVHKLSPSGGKGKKVAGGCHPTKNEAEAHKRALYANEPKAEHASSPVLVTVPNIPILEAGVEYELSTGPATFTPEDLRDAVTAANEDPSIPYPRLKIGHIDPRYNGAQYDGDPSFGKATNLRLSENGMVVFADFVGVPKWLAELLPTAYPSRSVEGFRNVQSGAGKEWRLALSAVAALGVKWPGITQLEDLPLYYGEEVPEGVEIDEQAIAAAGVQHPSTVHATANLDDVRIAFYNEYVRDHEGEGARYWWVRAVLTDPNQLVVEDEDTGQLYLLPFSSDDKGTVSFADPEAVRIDYVPDDAMKEAAAYVAATIMSSREVAASWASRAESSPQASTEGGKMDPKEVRKRLGLPEDATDEQVKQTIAEMNEAVSEEDPAPEPEPVPVPDPEPAPTPEPPAPEAVAPHVAAPTTVAAGGKPMVQLDAGTYEALQAAAKKGERAFDRLESVENDRILDDAIHAGKFPPSRRDAWAKYLEKDPAGGREAIKELQAGLVPVNELGSGGSGEGMAEEITYPVQLFPEIAKRKQREALIAAGHASGSRIATDGALRRGSGI